MRIMTVIAFVAASLGLWNGQVDPSHRPRTQVVPASYSPATPSSPLPGRGVQGLQLEAGALMRVRMSLESLHDLRAGMPWVGTIAGPVEMLHADVRPPSPSARRGDVVIEEVTIPARTPVSGVVTATRTMPAQGKVLLVTVRTRDARGRAVALEAVAGPWAGALEPELRFTVREIVTLE